MRHAWLLGLWLAACGDDDAAMDAAAEDAAEDTATPRDAPSDVAEDAAEDDAAEDDAAIEDATPDATEDATLDATEDASSDDAEVDAADDITECLVVEPYLANGEGEPYVEIPSGAEVRLGAILRNTCDHSVHYAVDAFLFFLVLPPSHRTNGTADFPRYERDIAAHGTLDVPDPVEAHSYTADEAGDASLRVRFLLEPQIEGSVTVPVVVE